MAGLARKKLKTEGKNSKLKEKTQNSRKKTQNSRKKLSFPAFPKTMNGRKVHKQKACSKLTFLNSYVGCLNTKFNHVSGCGTMTVGSIIRVFSLAPTPYLISAHLGAILNGLTGS